jgi:hypothetical protein
MASFREIDRVRKDPATFQAIADKVMKLYRAELTDWEADYLEQIRRRGVAELTTRQSEKLLEIRDGVEDLTEFLGLCVRLLLKACYEARLDLSEDDEEWIKQRWATSERSIKRKYVGRLMRCARELHIVDDEAA